MAVAREQDRRGQHDALEDPLQPSGEAISASSTSAAVRPRSSTSSQRARAGDAEIRCAGQERLELGTGEFARSSNRHLQRIVDFHAQPGMIAGGDATAIVAVVRQARCPVPQAHPRTTVADTVPARRTAPSARAVPAASVTRSPPTRRKISPTRTPARSAGPSGSMAMTITPAPSSSSSLLCSDLGRRTDCIATPR